MNPFEFVVVIVAVLGIAGVKIVDMVFGANRRSGEVQLRMAEQRVQELLVRLTELERHNDELRQQLEWSRRLLEAQDRVLQQLPPPTAPPPLSRV
jgi:hypothetical protein